MIQQFFFHPNYIITITLGYLTALIMIALKIFLNRKSTYKEMVHILVISIFFFISIIFSIPLFGPIYTGHDDTLSPTIAKDFPDRYRMGINEYNTFNYSPVASLYVPYFTIFPDAVSYLPVSILISYLAFLSALLLVWLIFKERIVVYSTALLLCLYPYVILYSRSSFNTMPALLFSLVSACATFAYIQNGRKEFVYAFFLSLNLAAIMRPETILIGIPLVFFIFIKRGEGMLNMSMDFLILFLITFPRYLAYYSTRSQFLSMDRLLEVTTILDLSALGIGYLVVFLFSIGLILKIRGSGHLVLISSGAIMVLFYGFIVADPSVVITPDKIIYAIIIVNMYAATLLQEYLLRCLLFCL